MKDFSKRDDFLVALTAFCYAVANCDGEIAEEEMDELDYYLNYIKVNSTLSPAVKGKLTKIKNRKDGFDKIIKKLDKVDVKDLGIFNEVLGNIIDADNVHSHQEIEVKEKWTAYHEQRKA